MQKTNKVLFLAVLCVMVFSCSILSLAASNAPKLSLEKNEYNSNGERVVKVKWEGNGGIYQVQISENPNFNNPITKNRTSSQGKYYNFVLSENVDATYYVRTRLLNGQWSNVVVANMNKVTISENNSYISIPKLPSIPNISNSISLPAISFRGLTFPSLIK